MSLSYHFLTPEEFFPFFRETRPKIFRGEFDFHTQAVMTELEKEKVKAMPKMENIQRYQLVAKDGDNIVGWSFGIQKSYDDFYMVNSAVFPEYRHRGIYTELMTRAVSHITDLGFQGIYSRHKMSNNAIIIPKLKFGFVITGFEVADVFGNLVELSYYTNPRRRELLEIRIGMRRPTEEDMRLVY
ncbi:MAG: GNAT family N-acetyltransferase [Chitinophagales bacterium]|nr:GNAT family N-acetyltransferase [Chitinophagales bacterium]